MPFATAKELSGRAAHQILARSTASNIMFVMAKGKAFAAAIGATEAVLEV